MSAHRRLSLPLSFCWRWWSWNNKEKTTGNSLPFYVAGACHAMGWNKSVTCTKWRRWLTETRKLMNRYYNAGSDTESTHARTRSYIQITWTHAITHGGGRWCGTCSAPPAVCSGVRSELHKNSEAGLPWGYFWVTKNKEHLRERATCPS